RDAVIAADRDRPGAGLRDAPEERRDPLDAELVVHALRERHVAQVAHGARLERPEPERLVDPPVVRRDVADGAGAEVLVALRGAVPGGVRDADERDLR